MYIKKIRHICNVRGCKNTDTFAVSKTREMGNSIIICADCAKEIAETIRNYDPKKVSNKKQSKPPKLFFNDGAVKTTVKRTAAEKSAPDKKKTERKIK